MRNILTKTFLAIFVLYGSLDSLAGQKTKFPKEKKMGAYLMVYFKDDTHGLYFALSKDGYSFTDVNNGLPVIVGDTIAEQKGIRDPYIYRAPDGTFYLALTDLHIYAKKNGFRETDWERDGTKYGWGNNRGLVLMRSTDLLNWSHSVLRVDRAFTELSDVSCAWAPELIYDKKAKQTMLYFTMRFPGTKEKVYYTHMNQEFTKMEYLPKILFEYPKAVSYIDADITRVGSKYHMFYVAHDDNTSGIKHAVSDKINKGYVYESAWIDPEPKSCEAPTVFKRIGEKKWVLIYDVFGVRPHNFGFSETSDFINYKNLGHFNQGIMRSENFSAPKHPSVIQITKEEASKLAKKWNLNMDFQ